MKPKLVCFDLWGTLAFDVTSTRDLFDILFGGTTITYRQFRGIEDQVLMLKDIDLASGLTEICRTLGVYEDVRDQIELVACLWKTAAEQANLYEDTLAGLKALRDRGYKLGLITNSTLVGWQGVETRFGLSALFDVVVVSCKEGFAKPDLKIYREVEERSGLSGQQVLMVGDSQVNDVTIPVDCGWQARLIQRASQTLEMVLGDLLSTD